MVEFAHIQQVYFIIGHVIEYPTMYYFRNPRHTQSIITYKILTEYLFLENPVKNCIVGGNVFNMPYCKVWFADFDGLKVHLLFESSCAK